MAKGVIKDKRLQCGKIWDIPKDQSVNHANGIHMRQIPVIITSTPAIGVDVHLQIIIVKSVKLNQEGDHMQKVISFLQYYPVLVFSI